MPAPAGIAVLFHQRIKESLFLLLMLDDPDSTKRYHAAIRHRRITLEAPVSEDFARLVDFEADLGLVLSIGPQVAALPGVVNPDLATHPDVKQRDHVRPTIGANGPEPEYPREIISSTRSSDITLSFRRTPGASLIVECLPKRGGRWHKPDLLCQPRFEPARVRRIIILIHGRLTER